MLEKTSDIWWLFSRQTVSITRKESVLNSAMLMKNRNFRHLPVLADSGKILGIISAQDIVDSLNLALVSSSSAEDVKTSLEIPVEHIMTGGPIVVEPGDGLKEVIKKFYFHNVGALPVVNMLGVVEGIMTLRDLVGLIGISSSPLNVPVSEVMNTRVTTIEPASPMAEAVRLMSEKRVRRLPVVTGSGEILGVLTNKDLLRHVARVARGGPGPSGFGRPVSDFMTTSYISVGSEDDLRVAANQMMIFGVGGLVVNDLPEGMALITERDLVRTLSSKRGVDFILNSMQYELEAPDPAAYARAHTGR